MLQVNCHTNGSAIQSKSGLEPWQQPPSTGSAVPRAHPALDSFRVARGLPNMRIRCYPILQDTPRKLSYRANTLSQCAGSSKRA